MWSCGREFTEVLKGRGANECMRDWLEFRVVGLAVLWGLSPNLRKLRDGCLCVLRNESRSASAVVLFIAGWGAELEIPTSTPGDMLGSGDAHWGLREPAGCWEPPCSRLSLLLSGQDSRGLRFLHFSCGGFQKRDPLEVVWVCLLAAWGVL